MTLPPYYAPDGGLPPQSQLLTDRAIFTDAYAFIPKNRSIHSNTPRSLAVAPVCVLALHLAAVGSLCAPRCNVGKIHKKADWVFAERVCVCRIGKTSSTMKPI